MKCWICGEEATTTRIVKRLADMMYNLPPSKYSRCYCEKCKTETDEKEKAELDAYVRMRKHRMLLTALDTLESQHTDMYEYRPAIEVVTEHIEKYPDKYDSSYEVLTAIILVHNHIRARMQQKVGRYQVDFILPEWFVVLEVDGDRHAHRKEYDSKRDKYIKEQLGEYWQIVRIKTDLLDQNAKRLPRAIKEVIKYRENGKVNWREV